MNAAIDLGDGWKAKPKFLRLVHDRDRDGRALRSKLREHADALTEWAGSNMAGYAIVVWSRQGNLNSGYLTLQEGSPISQLAMPGIVAEHLVHRLHGD